ncbi:MAG: hypothetical protein AAGU19_07900 [Prolixibacteraceae bacterium]
MTQSEFFKIKTSGRLVSFARQIELRKAGIVPASDFLLEFCKKMHPTGYIKRINGLELGVYSKTIYVYTLYKTSITRIKQPFGYSVSGIEIKEYDLPENLWQ